jgi:ubiquinone/menaquinone biosynthesis C-methylase UbiE
VKRREPDVTDAELARLEAEYMRRASNRLYAERYSYFNNAALLHVHSLERSLLALLKRYKFTLLTEKKILDVGCGSGTHLRRFLDYGASPTNLSGIDLLPSRIKQAQCLQPDIDWHVGSAHQLPYANATFDLVTSFVVFSSILDESLRQQIADEMWRVRKPGGLILVYDFVYSNPNNAAVRGVNQQKAKRLFHRPGARFDFRRITLAPPISRIIAPRAYWLATTLEQCKVLNTHMIGIISVDQEME